MTYGQETEWAYSQKSSKYGKKELSVEINEENDLYGAEINKWAVVKRKHLNNIPTEV